MVSPEPSAGPGGPPGRSLGLALVVLTACISGVSTFVNFYAVRGTSSDAFVTVRNLAVVGLLVPVAALTTRWARWPRNRSEWSRLVAVGVVGGGLPFLLFFHGLALASAAGGAAAASFGYRCLFLFATVLGLVVLRERLRAWSVVAAALLLAGNALLLAWTGPLWTDGTGFVLAATALWAVEYTLSRQLLRDLAPSTVALGRMGFGAIFLVGYLTATGQAAAVGALTAAQWQWVGLSAVLLTAFVASWYTALRRVEVGRATAVLTLGFPVTWLLSVVVRDGSFTLGQALGATAVVVGAALAVGWTAVKDGWAALAGRRYLPGASGP